MRSVKNYYRILNVGPTASTTIIRASFRRLAKKYHPDTSTLDPETAAVKMRVLLEAYRILMDTGKRAVYDLRFRRQRPEAGRSYRDSLAKKGNDPYARSLLIFYDLLHGAVKTALSNHENLLKTHGDSLDLPGLLGFADYLDFTFLLAEAYQQQGRYKEAALYYENAYREDMKWDYFRHFRAELKQRIRDLYCRKLTRQAEPDKAIGYYRKLLEEYSFPKNEQAFFYKKIAECYSRLGEMQRARENLKRALQLKPTLSGTKKIRQKLSL